MEARKAIKSAFDGYSIPPRPFRDQDDGIPTTVITPASHKPMRFLL